jgi:hypothetical protein
VNGFIDAVTRDPLVDRPGRGRASPETNAYRGVVECLVTREDWALVTSQHILGLFRHVLVRGYEWAEEEAGAFADLIAELASKGGTIVEDEDAPARALGGPDHEDNLVLTVAPVGGADVIVTGDTSLLALSPVKGRPIITPGEFVRRVARDGRAP